MSWWDWFRNSRKEDEEYTKKYEDIVKTTNTHKKKLSRWSVEIEIGKSTEPQEPTVDS